MHKAVYYTEQNNTVNSQSVDCTKALKLFALAIMEVASATEHFLLAKTQANGTTYIKNDVVITQSFSAILKEYHHTIVCLVAAVMCAETGTLEYCNISVQ